MVLIPAVVTLNSEKRRRDAMKRRLQQTEEQKSPEELRAMNKMREAKNEAELQEAKRKTYYCLYDEINKDMAKYSRLSGTLELSEDCLRAFKHATGIVKTSNYSKEFDYKPLGWEKADIYLNRRWCNMIDYNFQ